MNPSRPLALVTGARRGIGASIAVELAKHGFNLAVADVDPSGADKVLAALEEAGGTGRFFQCDLAQVHMHAALVDAVTAWGGPLVALVNNAGVPAPSRGDLLDLQPQAFDSVLGVNLRGTFFLTQAVACHMTNTPSDHARSIVTVSSVSATMASIERGEYCISKAGLPMLTQLFALRLAASGIGVFEVRPGIIRTAMTEAVTVKYEKRFMEGLVPMNRWGYPDDVARAVRALVSSELSFSTGSVISVDGALSIPRF